MRANIEIQNSGRLYHGIGISLSKRVSMPLVDGIGIKHISPQPNDPSSATRRTGRNDCNRDALAGFAAAHG